MIARCNRMLSIPVVFSLITILTALWISIEPAYAVPSLSAPHSINPAQVHEVKSTHFSRVASPVLVAQREAVSSILGKYVLIQDDTADVLVPLEVFQHGWLFQINKPDCRYLVALEPNLGCLRAFRLPLNWRGYSEPRFIASRYQYNGAILIQFDTNDLLEVLSGTVVWGNATGVGLDYLPVTVAEDVRIANLFNPWFAPLPDQTSSGEINTYLIDKIQTLDETKSQLIVDFKAIKRTFSLSHLQRNGLINTRMSGADILLCYFPSVDMPVVFENNVRFRDYSTSTLQFNLTSSGLQDSDTTSLWDRRGRCINGRRNMQGLKLYRIDSYIMYGFN